jgi:hypothetical protein
LPPHLSGWTENDPVTLGQVQVLETMLDGEASNEALEGFLIVCSRFVDEFRDHRTSELARIFKTGSPVGKEALRLSLENVCRWVGGLRGYISRYPVTIKRPAFPLFKIINIDRLSDRVYRILDSRPPKNPVKEHVKDYIVRTARLPPAPRQTRPVRRSKPLFHWCSYEHWNDPAVTAGALQILPEWSDCKLRATIPTVGVRSSAYVAFNGDRRDPEDDKLRFYKYFYEPLAVDHPNLPGGGIQIGVEGSPIVDILEEWDELKHSWSICWKRTP